MSIDAWVHKYNWKKEIKSPGKEFTCEILFPRSIMDAASDAALCCDSTCKAIPTSARAKEGASFMPSPTYKEQK